MTSDTTIFKKSTVALVISIIVCFFYMQRTIQPKNSFERVEGIITEITNTNDNYPGKDSARYRYIQIDNYPKPFELFVGKRASDFKPVIDRLMLLEVSDSVEIYFDETNKTRALAVNNLVFFIYRGQELIFEQGNSKKKLLYGIIAFCVFGIIILVILKQKGKIE
jgi:hypothetical protein